MRKDIVGSRTVENMDICAPSGKHGKKYPRIPPQKYELDEDEYYKRHISKFAAAASHPRAYRKPMVGPNLDEYASCYQSKNSKGHQRQGQLGQEHEHEHKHQHERQTILKGQSASAKSSCLERIPKKPVASRNKVLTTGNTANNAVAIVRKSKAYKEVESDDDRKYFDDELINSEYENEDRGDDYDEIDYYEVNEEVDEEEEEEEDDDADADEVDDDEEEEEEPEQADDNIDNEPNLSTHFAKLPQRRFDRQDPGFHEKLKEKKCIAEENLMMDPRAIRYDEKQQSGKARYYYEVGEPEVTFEESATNVTSTKDGKKSAISRQLKQPPSWVEKPSTYSSANSVLPRMRALSPTLNAHLTRKQSHKVPSSNIDALLDLQNPKNYVKKCSLCGEPKEIRHEEVYRKEYPVHSKNCGFHKPKGYGKALAEKDRGEELDNYATRLRTLKDSAKFDDFYDYEMSKIRSLKPRRSRDVRSPICEASEETEKPPTQLPRFSKDYINNLRERGMKH